MVCLKGESRQSNKKTDSLHTQREAWREERRLRGNRGGALVPSPGVRWLS